MTQVSPEQQFQIQKLLKKFEQKEVKELKNNPKDLAYAIKLIEHYNNLQETGGHLVKLFQPGPLSIEHYPRHKAFFDATATHKEVLFRAANRCLAEGTWVATPTLPAEIQNLRPGDMVLDRNHKPVPVVAVWDNGLADVVEFAHNSRSAICTPDHRFLIHGEEVRADKLGTPSGQARVWNLTVGSEDAYYVLDDGLVTHNCGKSESGAYTTVCWATGLYPDWWQGRVFDKATYGWVVGDTNDTVRTILQDKLLGTPHGTGLIPKDLIEDVVIRPNTGGTVDMIYVRHKPTGKISRIKFKTYQSGPESFYGAAPDYVWMDEEPSGKDAQLIWNQCYIRLLTTNGSLLITFTPLMGWTPLVKDFSESAEDLTPSDD